jgi:hypothetical protein
MGFLFSGPYAHFMRRVSDSHTYRIPEGMSARIEAARASRRSRRQEAAVSAADAAMYAQKPQTRRLADSDR